MRYNSDMTPKLTDDQRHALKTTTGKLVEVQDDQTQQTYVLMSIELFREMMGVGTDEEMAASLKAIDEGLAGVEAGRTRPFRDVLAELTTDA